MNTKVSSSDQTQELHLMIIWEFGRVIEKEILADLYSNYQVLGEYEINWDKEYFSENLTRFYGQNLPKNSRKERHCGVGEFLLVTFIDNSPVYDCVVSSRGSEFVNKNVFDSKEKFRKLTGGGHKIHATNNPKETAHDLALLLGANYSDYLQKYSKLESVCRETISTFFGGGALGWSSLEQLFSFLNDHLTYVVLRNFEVLPDNYYAKDHGDIDFLVDNLEKAVYLMGAKKVHRKDYRVYYQIRINGEEVFIDLRSVGDQYYDNKWETQILNNRRKLLDGFYVPSHEDYFYSLAYHALIHKKKIADDYHGKISLALIEIEPDVVSDELTFDLFFQRLIDFLSNNEYRIVCPKDKSVYFDTQYQYSDELMDEFSLLNIQEARPFLSEHWKNSSGCRYFQGKASTEDEVFIKLGICGETVKREFVVSKELFSEEKMTIPKVLYYRKNKEMNFVVFEKLTQFRTLNQIDKARLTNEFLETVFEGILEMVKVLHKTDIVHRDIRPANIIINDDDVPVLIDFQFAVDSEREKLKELKIVYRKPSTVKHLGENYARGRYRWDDAFSALVIFDEYVNQSTEKLFQIRKELVSLVGHKEIFGVNSGQYDKFFWSTKNTALLTKLKVNLIFYKVSQLFFKRDYAKKINKNSELLRKLNRVVQ